MDIRHLSFHVQIAALLLGMLMGSACTPKPVTTIQKSPTHPTTSLVSFDEVLQLLRSRPYDPAHLPLKSIPAADMGSSEMLRDAGRTLDSSADMLPPFRRLLHPNGVCLAGEWIIDRENPYSGLFKAGSRFPLVARLSPSNDAIAPHRLHVMSIGLVGKVFPAQDRRTLVQTANFITQTDIGGYISPKSKILYSDLVLTNAPDVTAVNRGLGLPGFARLGNIFDRVDVMKTERQLYPLAEAYRSGEPTRTPKFMKLTLHPGLETPDEGSGQDVRLEVWQQATPKNPLVYDITVSDRGETVGPDFLRRSRVHWEMAPIGRLVFAEAILSKACDDQIHFQHPAWREDVNDPVSSVRAKNGVAFGQPLVVDQVAIGGELLSPSPVSRVFSELNNITAWPTWLPDHLVSAATESPQAGFYHLTFNFEGQVVQALCKHDTLHNAALSLHCRGTTETAFFFTRPVEQNLTFVLTAIPGGKTQIAWELVLKSKHGGEVRDTLQSRIQRQLVHHFNQLGSVNGG